MGEAGKNRILGEFFIVNSIHSKLPPPLVKFSDKQTFIHHYPITKEIILCLRFVKFAKSEDWHGDKELIILRNNLKQGMPYS